MKTLFKAPVGLKHQSDDMARKSDRASTVLKTEASYANDKQVLAWKLHSYAWNGRLNDLLIMLASNNFGSTEYLEYLKIPPNDGHELCSTMIDCIRSPKMKDKYGDAGVRQAIKALCNHGADMTIVTKSGRDLLDFACGTGDTNLVDFIIKKSPAGIARQGPRPVWLPPRLFHATSVPMAQMLINHGAGVDERGRIDVPILSHHIQSCRTISKVTRREDDKLKMLEFLINAGCDASAFDRTGRSVLHTASNWQGEPEIIQLLIDNNADVNFADGNGETPLHVAVRSARLELVQTLCQNGADLSTEDDDGLNPVHWAVRYGSHRDFLETIPHSRVQILRYLDAEKDRIDRVSAFGMIAIPRLARGTPGHQLPPELVEDIVQRVQHMLDQATVAPENVEGPRPDNATGTGKRRGVNKGGWCEAGPPNYPEDNMGSDQ